MILWIIQAIISFLYGIEFTEVTKGLLCFFSVLETVVEVILFFGFVMPEIIKEYKWRRR